MTKNYIIVGGNDAANPDRSLGGKAANLEKLIVQGFSIPRFFCVTTEALVPFLDGIPWRQQLAGGGPGNYDTATKASRAIVESFMDAPFASELETEMFQAFDQLFAADAKVAVRSSAVGEDSAEHSFAGQLQSYLYVSRHQLGEKIKQCLLSAFSPHALFYRQRHDQLTAPIRTAVVVQEMIQSASSGVLFTANPVTDDGTEAVISAAYGLGEGVVADRVESDTYFLSKATGAVTERQLSGKTQMVVFDEAKGTGTRLAGVSPDKAEQPVLSDAQLRALYEQGQRIEALYGTPQDIEWAFDDTGQLHIIQARPITTPARELEQVFDNANIIEGYPGVTTPLTFSFARRAYEIIFRNMALTLGASRRAMSGHRTVFANMIGLIHGRIYYNISNWYTMYSLIPVMKYNLRSWEKALGLQQWVQRQGHTASPAARGIARWRALLRSATCVLWHFITLGVQVRRFHHRQAAAQAFFAAHTLAALPADRLLSLYETLVDRLLLQWHVTTVNDLFAFAFYHRLGNLIKQYGLDSQGTLQNALLCGETGMESVQPVQSVLALTDEVRATRALQDLFNNVPDNEAVWEQIQKDPRFSDFRQAIDSHLQKFGDRTIHELKLETPTADEDPSLLIALLRGYLKTDRSARTLHKQDLSIRRAAETRVKKQLRARPLRRWVFHFVLRHCRATVTNRENMRLARTRAFGIVKRIFRQIGRVFARDGIIDAPEDIFYLGVEEIADYIRGSAICCSLKELVILRKREYEDHRRQTPADRITTEGIVYTNTFDAPASDSPGDNASLLEGIGCSTGRVRGKAKVITDPAGQSATPGEILVARATDPGWVFLMVAAAGIVVERGNILSHTAIIGRELGIPTVIGVAGATSRIRSGQTIEIDGGTGTVQLAPGGDADTVMQDQRHDQAEVGD